ncbi:MAG: DUF421 domain-containing protein [Oscillospiraceae bacterium]
MELLQVALTSVASVITLFLLSKLMGNKQISQLSMFDYIIGISIGSIAAEFATELENPERTLIAMVIYAASAFLVSVITGKSPHLRKIINGRPLILFDKGKFYLNNMKKARIDVSDFLTHCRNQGYFDLSQVQTAVFEYNGSLSILPVETNRPLEPSDMNLNPVQQNVLVNVILDGHINEVNLKKAGKDSVWLEKQLNNQNYHNAKEVFLGCVDTVKDSLVLYPAEKHSIKSDPFE